MAPALLALMAIGCVVSPQPSPPEPSLDGHGIGVAEISTADFTNLLSFKAAPGTVKPAEGVVIVTNLSNTDAPSSASVAPDGSFSIALGGFPGDTVRFQAKLSSARSQPFDITVGADGVTFTEPPALPTCLTIEPAHWLALQGKGDAQTILVRNACAFTVQLGAPTLRRGQGPFGFAPTQGVALTTNQTGFVTVRVDGGGTETEDVLFLDLGGGLPRQAITLTDD